MRLPGVRDGWQDGPGTVAHANHRPRSRRERSHVTSPGTAPPSREQVRPLSAPALARAQLALRRPGLSAQRRLDLARDTALGLVAAGNPRKAEELVRQQAARLDRDPACELLAAVAKEVLDGGVATDLAREAYAAVLARADVHLAAGRKAKAAEAFAEAMWLAFHRVLHFDGLTSPLAADPAGYTAPLRESSTAQALRAPRDEDPQRREAAGGRILFTTRVNANFLAELRRYVDQELGLESRFADLADDGTLNGFAGRPARIARQILTGGPALPEAVAARLSADTAWADVVFVEWCLPQAVFQTMLPQDRTRVVVRLHSQEVFTLWPHLVDFSRVDDVVFVSAHLRDLAVAAIPGLSGPRAPRLHVIPLALELAPFAQPKADDARFTLALVGWSSPAKDPRWALEVLEELRRHDRRYRLLLVGADYRADVSAAAREYGVALSDQLAALERADAVRRLGQRDDVPEVLRSVGVLLSTSVRESFHAAVVEGAASGAVPVVRDWPFFAAQPHGARTLFPADWVVATPAEAAARVLAVTTDGAVWREHGAAAAAHARATWDWSVVRGRYDVLLSPTSRA